MRTQEAVDRFLDKCEERGLAPDSVRVYRTSLKHFVEDFPDLPTDTASIERFLKKHKETPAHRGQVFKRLQAFYSYLVYEDGIKSPVPPSGKVGRPPKQKLVHIQPQATFDEIGVSQNEKLVIREQPLLSTAAISTQEALDKFYTQRKNVELSESTFKVYRGVFTPFLRRFPILPLDPGQIEEFIASIQAKPMTKHKYKRTLKSLYVFLERRYKVPNPFEDIVVGNPPRRTRVILTEDQLQRLFNLPLDPQDKTLLLLIQCIGLRAGAIRKLRREDVHDGYVHLQEKTGEYDLPIPPELEGRLKMLASSGLLFRSPKGPLKENYLYKKIRRWLEAVGVKEGKKGPHMLRHTFAVRYLRKGGDLQSLSQLLGHKNISTTQIYAEMAREDLRGQLDKVKPLEGLVPKEELVRAICYGCNTQLVIESSQVKNTKCPGCQQTGNWYLPDTRYAEQAKHEFDQEEIERLAALWGSEEEVGET